MKPPARPGRPRVATDARFVAACRSLTRAQLLHLLGAAPSSFDRWRGEGLPAAGDGTSFDLAAVVGWMRSSWLDARRAAAGARSGEEELARLRAVRCAREELRLARERGELVEHEVVAAEWRRRVLAVRSKLLALPRTLAGRCAASPPEDIEAEAKRQVRDMLDDFAAGGDLTPVPDELDAHRKDTDSPTGAAQQSAAVAEGPNTERGETK